MKERHLKLLTVILWLHVANFFVGSAIMAIVLKVEPGGTAHKWFVALWMLIGIALVVTTLSVASKANNKVKADVFFLGDLSFDTWRETFISTIETYGYKAFRSELDELDYSLSLFVQPQSRDPFSCIIIVKTHELSDTIIETVNDNITEHLKEYLNCNTIRTNVDMTSVFCVDKVSPALYGIVNGHMWQGLKQGRLVVGISFGGKRMYVGKFADGYGKWKYKKLREQFIAMAGLEGQEPISKN